MILLKVPVITRPIGLFFTCAMFKFEIKLLTVFKVVH